MNAKKILHDLKEKSEHVQWNNNARKEYFAIFAKSFKEKIKEYGVMLFDLDDIFSRVSFPDQKACKDRRG